MALWFIPSQSRGKKSCVIENSTTRRRGKPYPCVVIITRFDICLHMNERHLSLRESSQIDRECRSMIRKNLSIWTYGVIQAVSMQPTSYQDRGLGLSPPTNVELFIPSGIELYTPTG